MIHIFHSWQISMTYDHVIHTCTICGKQKKEPWHPVLGWSRPPKVPKPENVQHILK